MCIHDELSYYAMSRVDHSNAVHCSNECTFWNMSQCLSHPDTFNVKNGAESVASLSGSHDLFSDSFSESDKTVISSSVDSDITLPGSFDLFSDTPNTPKTKSIADQSACHPLNEDSSVYRSGLTVHDAILISSAESDCSSKSVSILRRKNHFLFLCTVMVKWILFF